MNEKQAGPHQETINGFSRVQYAIRKLLKEDGKMTKRLERDYQEFCQTASNMFETDSANFSLDKLMVKIPNNKWIQVFLDHAKYLK